MTQEEKKKRVLITGGSGFIGTNTMDSLLAAGHEVLDVSTTPALNPDYEQYRREVDILDANKLEKTFCEFQPHWVIHLAARAECDESTTIELGYRANTAGTKNVLDAIKATPSVERAVITSSQFVCGPGYAPKHDQDYAPVTIYGQSKVLTEQLTREANLACTWTLVRPTNIWGPWHMRYTREFWRIAQKGLYVHPAGAPVIRSYGYVGNLVWQISQILRLPEEKVHAKVFYLGDRSIDIYKWANGFTTALGAGRARRLPRPFLRLLGGIGDVISAVSGKQFYITSSRYRSMVSNYVVDMDKTFDVLGVPPFTLDQGVVRTVEWLKSRELS